MEFAAQSLKFGALGCFSIGGFRKAYDIIDFYYKWILVSGTERL